MGGVNSTYASSLPLGSGIGNDLRDTLAYGRRDGRDRADEGGDEEGLGKHDERDVGAF